MNITPVKTPGLLKHIFPNLVWSLSPSEKIIYLTFDDGPTREITNWTLNILDQYNAKATFFCIGKNVRAHPDIYQNIIKEGHSIGNHTFDHVKGWKSSTVDYLKNIEKASYLIPSKLFRPPYGQITPKQSALIVQKGYQIIMWNILSLDWDKKVEKERCVNNVLKNASSGDIVVFHDSLKAQHNLKYALPKVLEYYTKKEYEFKRIPE